MALSVRAIAAPHHARGDRERFESPSRIREEKQKAAKGQEKDPGDRLRWATTHIEARVPASIWPVLLMLIYWDPLNFFSRMRKFSGRKDYANASGRK